MNLRRLAVSVAGMAGLTLFGSFQAHAAITVLGNNSLAQECYQAAEMGGDLKDGVQDCTDALQTQPLSAKDRSATLVNRGILRAELDDSQGALTDYNTGIAINPALGEAYVDRGATLIALKHWAEALTDIDKGLSLGANRPYIAYYDRAIADEALGNIRDAYEDYKKAVEIEPGFTLATQQLARFRVVNKADGT